MEEISNSSGPEITEKTENRENEKPKPVILRVIALTVALMAVILPVLGGLVLGKVIKFNDPAGLRGADVSVYQGDIDWPVLSQQIDFVFIKATEGSGYVDDRFAYNWEGAAAAGLPAGAYHFFSFDSSGKTQADNFIGTLKESSGGGEMLPPVIDVEFYGDYISRPLAADEVREELRAMIDEVERLCGTKPIIYCTDKAYRLYSSCFDDCPLWIRNVYFYPVGKEWTFWQFSDTETLRGYSGDEKYIDMNVFDGTASELKKLMIRL